MVPEVDTCRKAEVKLFCIGRPQEILPTTSDTTKFHIMPLLYQTSVWNQAHSPNLATTHAIWFLPTFKSHLVYLWALKQMADLWKVLVNELYSTLKMIIIAINMSFKQFLDI